MGAGDLGDDRQPQAGPPGAAGTVGVEPGEAVEHRVTLLGWHPLAVVVDGDHGARSRGVRAIHGEPDHHGLAGVPPRVVDEVAHDPQQGVGVADQSGGFHRAGDLESAQSTEPPDLGEDDVVEVHVLATQRDTPLVVLGQQEEILDHRPHPLDLGQQEVVHGLHVDRGAGGRGQLQQRRQRGQGAA